MRKYFGTDGVRGKANVFPMTADFTLKLGQAIATLFLSSNSSRHIVIGKDTRLSCYMFESALVSGLCSLGIDAVLVGSIPTPAISFMTKSIRAAAGIVISASHNDYTDNGIKIFSSDGNKLSDEIELKIENLIDENNFQITSKIGKALRIETAVGRYVEFVKSSFDKNLTLRSLKVVVDCANGAAYKVAPMAIGELGANIVVINDKPDGTNINRNCGALYPQSMIDTVLATNADIGISLDGDGDRLIACDSKGELIDGDIIMGICAKFMKNNNLLYKDSFVATIMSNQGLINSMNKEGISVIRSDVGDRYVMEAMKNGNYCLGGEQSGHIIFSEYTPTGDGLISALQLMKVMIKEGKTLNELKKDIETYPQVLINKLVDKKIPIKELKESNKLVSSISDKIGKNGRVLLRYSGTENMIRVMIEGPDNSIITEYANDIANTVVKEINSLNY